MEILIIYLNTNVSILLHTCYNGFNCLQIIKLYASRYKMWVFVFHYTDCSPEHNPTTSQWDENYTAQEFFLLYLSKKVVPNQLLYNFWISKGTDHLLLSFCNKKCASFFFSIITYKSDRAFWKCPYKKIVFWAVFRTLRKSFGWSYRVFWPQNSKDNDILFFL